MPLAGLLRPLCLGLAVPLLAGCASWKLDKTVAADPGYVAVLPERIERVRAMHRAVYEVAVFAVDRCARKTTMEPLALLTMGQMYGVTDPKEKAKVAAYWKVGGFDERWHVLWAGEGVDLAPGDEVVTINGKSLENNRTNALVGEAPLVAYFNAAYRARSAAEDGKPFVVRRADGREVTVPARPACLTMLYAMPTAEPSGFSQLLNGTVVVLPPNAINAARSEDERRYLAAIAVYLTGSPQANGRRWGKVAALVGTIAVGVVAAPVLVTVGNFPIAAGIDKVFSSGMTEEAALFATEVVADMGGSPGAGLALVERLQAKRLEADRVLLDEQSKAKVRALIDQLSKGKAQ